MTVTTYADDPLEVHRWNHRVLLVFSPRADDPRARETDVRLSGHACGVQDRDLVVGRLPASGEATLGASPVEAASAARLRQRYRVVDPAFTVVLIGKDGGEKARSDEVPDLDDLFALIDGMPMRVQEQMDRGRDCGG